MRPHPTLKDVICRHDAFYRHLGPLLRFYAVHVRDRLTDCRSILNRCALGKRPAFTPTPFPSYLYVAPTNRWNANCRFCPYRTLRDDLSTMDMETFERLIDQFVALGGRQVNLTPAQGEALIDPTLFRKIAYCKTRALRVWLTTNGILLSAGDNANAIVASGLDHLCISLADFDPKYDSHVYSVSEAVSKRRLDGLLTLVRTAAEKGMRGRLVLGMRPMRPYGQVLNEMQATPFWPYYRNKVFTFEWLHAYDNWGGSIAQSDLPGIQRLRTGARVRIYECAGLYNLSILPNGDARLCGCRAAGTMHDDLVSSNVHTQTLAAIWDSPRRKRIVEDFIAGHHPRVCVGCTFYGPRIPGRTDHGTA